MRKLMWLTLGFGASCGLCIYAVPDRWRVGLTVAAAVLAVLAAGMGKRLRFLPGVAAALFGCVLGIAWFSLFDGLYLSHAAALDGMTRDTVIRAADYSYETDYGMAVDGTVNLNGKPYRLRAYLEEGDALVPGDTLSGRFRFRMTAPEGESGGTYHSGKGIFLLAYQTDAVEVSSGGGGEWRDFPARFRRQIQAILHSCLPEDAEAFARALLLGDSSLLDYGTNTNLKVSGIRHVVAVSGLHVSILFALLTAVTFRKRFLTAAVGFPTLLLFAAVAGFTPSVNRACIMWALVLLALLLEREFDGATALSFAALVMLICNPLVITSVSFQLSIASVSGIYLFASGIQTWILSLFGNVTGKKRQLPRWIADSVSITLAAMVFTTPLCAWHFGSVSLVGVVTNLLALWVISFLFCMLMATCLLGAFWTGGAVLLGKIAAWPIRYVLTVARVMADFPLAAVYTRSPYIILWLIFVYVLLILFLLSRNRQPVTFLCCAALGLCLALLASWGEPMLDDTRMTVLDVGQGQCILLQSEGRTYMVDCGGDSDESAADLAAETLLSQGISRLDGLILTHCDRDHAGAAGNLLGRVKADLVVLPASGTAPEHSGGEVIYVDRDLSLGFGTAALNIYAPNFPGNSNERSLCLLFDTENCDILITGDRSALGEGMLLDRENISKVDVLIAGHHGSRNSTSKRLLSSVRPEIVCISVGEDNPYGHPSGETLTRLAEFGCAVYRTDTNGTIMIRR